MTADSAELMRQVTARRARRLARASPWPMLWIASGTPLFISGGCRIDPVAAPQAVGQDVLTPLLLPLLPAVR